MQWENLLSLKRQGDTNKRLRIEQQETRLGFEVDYDRIIFSSPFRSLQDKTQVIPFSKTSFVHTRLTHSLEVSVVGRSLGRAVGKQVLEKHPHLHKVLGYQFYDFGAIVAAAALAHDIGNPPFGHSGEKAIGDFFLHGKGSRFKKQLTPEEYHDLILFEGNAHGFKLLTQSKNGVEGGLRLSYATLGAFTKYPKQVLPIKPTTHIADKKYGVFQEQVAFFKELANELELIPLPQERFARHPLAFLVEAADDICYTLIDFEDGINLGWIEEDVALEYLINLVKNSINRNKYNQLTLAKDRLAYLRSLAINTLINDAVNVFLENEVAILKGNFNTSLLDKGNYKAQMDDIINISIQKIYKSTEVVDKEISGYQIIAQLLETFSTAIENKMENNLRHYDQLILQKMQAPKAEQSLYHNLLACCSYVANLTDGQALQYYQKIRGLI